MSGFTVGDESVPFDPCIHLHPPPVLDEETKKQIEIFRKSVEAHPLYENHSKWADDAQLLRFLIARNFDQKKSLDMISTALTWREERMPHEIDTKEGWELKMSNELATGKMYINDHDKWGRSLIILDNTVQNTSDVDGQMTGLAWILESAIKLNRPNTDKYLIFIHLTNFSIWNAPVLSVRETALMLTTCYPERLGHCIIFQPPAYFTIFYNTISGLLDAKTAGKILFINGDVSDGSENDIKLRSLIGDDWKKTTGACQEMLQPNSTPNYLHSVNFPATIARLDAIKEAGTEDTGESATVVSNPTEDGNS